MVHIAGPRQSHLFDPFEHLFSPLAFKSVQNGWQGVFRHVILELLPAKIVAGEFHPTMGRPAKELYSAAGLTFIMEFQDWTKEEAVGLRHRCGFGRILWRAHCFAVCRLPRERGGSLGPHWGAGIPGESRTGVRGSRDRRTPVRHGGARRGRARLPPSRGLYAESLGSAGASPCRGAFGAGEGFGQRGSWPSRGACV